MGKITEVSGAFADRVTDTAGDVQGKAGSASAAVKAAIGTNVLEPLGLETKSWYQRPVTRVIALGTAGVAGVAAAAWSQRETLGVAASQVSARIRERFTELARGETPDSRSFKRVMFNRGQIPGETPHYDQGDGSEDIGFESPQGSQVPPAPASSPALGGYRATSHLAPQREVADQMTAGEEEHDGAGASIADAPFESRQDSH